MKLWKLYHCYCAMLGKLQPLALLGVRIWVAAIFFQSGLVKIGDMENTLLLFRYEYQVPYLPVAVAAYSATFFELAMPILLVLGLMARLMAVPLLVMTAVIHFTYQEHITHYYWALMLGLLMIFGAGKLSLDYLLSRKCTAKCADEKENADG